MSRPFALVSLLLAAAGGTAALAAIPGDTDNDGRLSLDEFTQARRAAIMRADADHDGKLSRTEFNTLAINVRNELEAHGVAQSVKHTGRTELFLLLDTSKDGYLSVGEINTGLTYRFERLDVDHDGFITPKEMKARGF